MASSSSTALTLWAPPLPHNWKYHVFPSFHGPDVRKTILGHIVKEFKSKGIDLFIDNDIERSKSIGPELVEAIKGSRISIVLLSKNYPSSTWCLNELVEIMNCREEFGQTVISLFYQVDPTDVKKQTGDFGKVFENTCRGKTEEKIRRWKHALTEVAQIAGYHSTNWGTEAEMIEAIATDVSDKLNNTAPSSDFEGLVGMESQMTKMSYLLRPDSDEVRKIGIWGPPGIGKTTIARCFFNRHARYFQMSVFMGNIKRTHATMDWSDDYSVKLKLQKKIMSLLTNEKDIKVQHLGVAKDRLKDKKVLVVLDDVDRSVQVEAMANETWFGPGSRILITTQDQRVLRASGVKHIHRVDLPSHDKALQMFCIYAFDQKYPKAGFEVLAWKVTDLVGYLPLGLKVMGSYFQGMPEENWIEALPRLKTHVDRDGEIAGVLKFSYDALNDEDKSLFLHIACFFYNEDGAPFVIQIKNKKEDGEPELVESCLEKCFLDVRQGLRVLLEKTLIDIDKYEQIRMAKLLVQLGRKIVREEYVNEPGKRRFLLDAKDIEEVLNDDKIGSNSVIGIKLHWDASITWTSERAFEKLSNLQFLRIQGGNPKSMNYISRKIRVLSWPEFEMTCFPSSFNPEFLVKLEMQHSGLKKLWEGIQSLSNLKWMDLSESGRLKELPDLSTATNLYDLNLRGCSRLVKLPYSIGNVINLKKLHLGRCFSLVELPSSIGNAINLTQLDLSGCKSLVELPSSIGNAINLTKLDLSGCQSLVELPSSIGNAIINLTQLHLSRCKSLVELPSSIGNAINLRYLRFYGCSNLMFLPYSIGNMTNLQELDLSHCSSLTKLPSSMRNLGRLSELDLRGCSMLEVNLANVNLESLEELHLSDCSSLKSYHESCTDIQQFDPWVARISHLPRLVLRGMKKLVSLPPFPESVVELDAENCESLERLDCSFRNPDICLNFRNCFKLNQEARDLISLTRTSEYAVFPAEEVPQCFPYRSYGSSVTVKLNQMPLGKSTKFKVCICAGEKESISASGYVGYIIKSRLNSVTSARKRVDSFSPGHLYTFEVEVETEKLTSSELVFEFFFKTGGIKECGILQLLEVPFTELQRCPWRL